MWKFKSRKDAAIWSVMIFTRGLNKSGASSVHDCRGIESSKVSKRSSAPLRRVRAI
jgi:hypothetical protein